MKRLKIALVANNIHFRGGMERYCAELANYLCADHDVHLFASEIDNIDFDHVTIHPVPTVKRPIIKLFAQFYVRSTRALKGQKFDIVHTIGGITAQQNVVTAQYCQYAWGDVLRRQGAYIEGISPYHHFMWRMSGFFERRAVRSRKTLAVIANSKKTGDDLVRFYGCAPNKIEVIYNGVDPGRFSPDNRQCRTEIRRQYGLSDDDIVVLFVGEYRRKGLETVVRALGRIPDPRVKLLAIGRGDKEHYTQLARSVGVESRVLLADPTPNVERVFGSADAFAFPTFYEPFGMVITEAMASGLPTITTRTAGAAEFIVDGASGFLIDDARDDAALADRLERLASDADLRASMGKAGRSAVQDYDWRLVGEKTLAVYLNVAR